MKLLRYLITSAQHSAIKEEAGGPLTGPATRLSFANGKSVPHSSRLYRDEWAAGSCRPLRLDFNNSRESGSVVVEAAPSILLRGCGQSPFYGVSVGISDHFGPGCFTMDVRVKITVLPELRAITAQFA